MLYDDCSIDARRASVARRNASHRWRRHELLHGFATILGRTDAARVALHVLVSLGAAFGGSIAAIVLVPLIQPGHVPMFGGRALALPTSRETLISFLVAAIGGCALLRWFVSRLGARIVSDCAVRLRSVAHARLIDADIGMLSGSSSAEISNVLTSNVDLVVQGVGAMLQLLVAGLTTAVSLAFAFWVSPALTLILPALAGFGLIASRYNGLEQSRISRQYVEDMTRLFWLSEDFPRRLRHVRSFEREDAERTGYRVIAARLGRGYRRQIELAASGKLVMELLAAIGMAVVFTLAGRWRGMDQASLMAVGLLLGRLLPYMTSTRHNFQQLHMAAPAFALWQRYANMIRSHREMQRAADAGETARPVHIERMQLRLPSLRLDIESLMLSPGEMTLIAGDSGIGKSSLADVLAGMTKPVSFVARVGARSVDFDAYRRLARKGAYVSQGVRSWQRTVRECLLWAAPDTTDERLREALTDVGLYERLRDAQDGLDTELQGASCRLSGGELQRLLLAQVILRQPFVAVLDEATGALDVDSEMKVLATLKRRLSQSILIVVSHRQGPLGIADQCLRIGRGGIATIVRGKALETVDNLGEWPGAMG